MINHIIISLLFLSVGFSQKVYDINHIVLQNGVYIKKFSDEIVNGKVFQMFGDMKVPLGNMKDGKKDGKWMVWYDNGLKRQDGTYKDGEFILSNSWTEYGEIMVKDGIGLYTLWMKNGKKSIESTYKNGKLNGTFTTFSDGKKSIEVTYKDGKKDGLYTNWYKDKKVTEGNYKDGEKDGIWTWWMMGKKWEEEIYKNGVLISKKEWNEDGSVKE